VDCFLVTLLVPSLTRNSVNGTIARTHDLAVRNQKQALSPSEKESLFAFAKAGALFSILPSKVRRTLKIKLENPASA
jgi:hypothetical protein